ncbi:hypothetical protein ACU61A_15810 [Pseudonocardia sichuanensis]
MTVNVTCYGGPLNCQVMRAPDPAPEVVQRAGGHYRLIDGAYRWHTGPQADDQDVSADVDVSAEAGDVEHVRPAPKPVTRKPRARTHGK